MLAERVERWVGWDVVLHKKARPWTHAWIVKNDAIVFFV